MKDFIIAMYPFSIGAFSAALVICVIFACTRNDKGFEAMSMWAGLNFGVMLSNWIFMQGCNINLITTQITCHKAGEEF